VPTDVQVDVRRSAAALLVSSLAREEQALKWSVLLEEQVLVKAAHRKEHKGEAEGAHERK